MSKPCVSSRRLGSRNDHFNVEEVPKRLRASVCSRDATLNQFQEINPPFPKLATRIFGPVATGDAELGFEAQRSFTTVQTAIPTDLQHSGARRQQERMRLAAVILVGRDFLCAVQSRVGRCCARTDLRAFTRFYKFVGQITLF